MSQYSLLGGKLPRIDDSGIIKWHIVNFPKNLDKYKTILAFEKVFQTWQAAFDLVAPKGRYIKLETTKFIDQADIRIFVCQRNHLDQEVDTVTSKGVGTYEIPCPFEFDGEQGVLAHAYPITSSFLPGDLHLDQEEHWADMHRVDIDGNKTTMFVHLMTVALHEVGHNFVLNHSKVKDAVMYASYNGIKEHLHSDDLKGLNKYWRKEKLRIAKLQGYTPSNFCSLFRIK